MPHQTSPGVDRVLAVARETAEAHGSPQVHVVHFMLALLHEEDGKPRMLLQRLGHDGDAVRATLLQKHGAGATVSENKLLDMAREWSLIRRADPTVMTDALLVAVLR